MSVYLLPKVLTGFEGLSAEIRQASTDLASHPLNAAVREIEDLRTYVSYHVWCVWDFMCLAVSVEEGIGRPEVPWIPPKSAALRFAARELLNGEESDIGPTGVRLSHFEAYLAAMTEIGADIAPITQFIDLLRQREHWRVAMEIVEAPPPAREFVEKTLDFCQRGLPARVGALCLGREDLLPSIFNRLLPNLENLAGQAKTFVWYVQRHIQMDTAVHGPLTEMLFAEVTGDDPCLIEEALLAGKEAIAARKSYMDSIYSEISQRTLRG